MAFKMTGWSPFKYGLSMSNKRRQRKASRIDDRITRRKIAGRDVKRLEDKLFNVENPWWKDKEKELDELGSRPENKPYWQSGYQKKMAKQGKTTSGYLDAKYRRRGIKSYAPGID